MGPRAELFEMNLQRVGRGGCINHCVHCDLPIYGYDTHVQSRRHWLAAIWGNAKNGVDVDAVREDMWLEFNWSAGAARLNELDGTIEIRRGIPQALSLIHI